MAGYDDNDEPGGLRQTRTWGLTWKLVTATAATTARKRSTVAKKSTAPIDSCTKNKKENLVNLTYGDELMGKQSECDGCLFLCPSPDWNILMPFPWLIWTLLSFLRR